MVHTALLRPPRLLCYSFALNAYLRYQVLFTDQKGKPVAHNPGTLNIIEGEDK